MSVYRVGQGFDIHRLVSGRPLMIGGVSVDSPVGCEAHSDGDVVLHALIDALLGATGLGDIGEHFPDTDERYRDIGSAILLSHVVGLIAEKGWRVVNTDCTVFLEQPKLIPYKPLMRERLAHLLGVSQDSVSVKAKTAEKLGAIGNSEAIGASVVVLLERV